MARGALQNFYVLGSGCVPQPRPHTGLCSSAAPPGGTPGTVASGCCAGVPSIGSCGERSEPTALRRGVAVVACGSGLTVRSNTRRSYAAMHDADGIAPSATASRSVAQSALHGAVAPELLLLLPSLGPEQGAQAAPGYGLSGVVLSVPTADGGSQVCRPMAGRGAVRMRVTASRQGYLTAVRALVVKSAGRVQLFESLPCLAQEGARDALHIARTNNGRAAVAHPYSCCPQSATCRQGVMGGDQLLPGYRASHSRVTTSVIR